MQRILGDIGIGYYSTAFEIYNVMLIISSYSLPLAVSKMVSAQMAKKRRTATYQILKCALLFATISGTTVALILFFGGNFFATTLLNTPYSIFALRVLAPGLLVVAVLVVIRGFFQGLVTMMPSAVSQIIEQIVNAIVSVWAAYVLYRTGTRIGAVLGDYNPEAGAWIRFNPLDGNGCKNENVTEYRYALVESDHMELEQQNAILRELELPIACLVYSGKKSLHAIVRVDAADYNEYRKRVDYLYEVCQKNGIDVDTQNRNPSRLSRMPGVRRGEKKQFIVDTNIGKQSWNEWYEWIEGVNDDLPEPEGLESVWDNLPELSPCLIDGILRKGHKMLISGPSKAGKSFLQIELCIAIAEGKKWLQWHCAQGRVMYVNLELDRASCLHRFKDVYEAMGFTPDNLQNIDIWNLRGKSVPMDKLAPKLIRRAAKKNYVAIIIDPIYKVITGDENSADQMANFCNQFDKVCTELGCAVIYCHHHSKGNQGGKKSMDRASGSGVFARDPDALLDLIELEPTEALMKQEENKAICKACTDYLDAHFKWEDDLSQDDLLSSAQMMSYCEAHLDRWQKIALDKQITETKAAVQAHTAWRIEGTLREFPKFEPVNMWFEYPVHCLDQIGVLKDLELEADKPAWQKGREARKKQGEQARKAKKEKYKMAIENFRFTHEDKYPTVKELYEVLKSDAEATGEKYPEEKTVRNSLKEIGFMVNKDTRCICPIPETF